ncbi:MAG TPA: DUF4178 domain-containing protein [Thermoanaerobaculia bacterium]|jgi:hypothetical protein
MAVANCPSCGGQIEFKIGSSAAVICDHCRTVVARTDRGLEDLGKVAALVDTGSPLRRDLPGKIRGAGYRLVGRTQMRHPMGGVWDEWYAAFDSGQWGWIAEAQGKYYVTVKEPRAGLPPYNVLQVGGRYDGLTVTEVGSATVIAGEGEIPWRVEPNSTYQYADLSGANNRFATIDYSEEPPLFFDGEETTLEGLGINVDLEQARVTRVKVVKLACSQCGGPLNLVAPEQAERIVCPNCGAMHDVGEGNLRYLETLSNRGPQPLIPLGKAGKIGDERYIVAGMMQRSVTFDQKYYWTEYLLFATHQKSFAWLVEDGGHWSFVKPASAGAVQDPEPGGAAPRIEFSGKTYAIFQDSVATVESVVGEFYWKVTAGETARAVDYIAPPEGLTKEFSDTAESHEVNYSHALYMTPEEVEAAFEVTGLPRPTTLGTLQPIAPGQKPAGCVGCGLFTLLVIALLALAGILAATLPERTIANNRYYLGDYSKPQPATTAANSWDQPTTTTEGGEASATFFSPPLTVHGGHNLQVTGSTHLDNDWVYIGGDLFNEKTGLVEPFELKLEHYSGVDDGESWEEGSQQLSSYFSRLAPGTYSLRMEAHWDATKPPPIVDVQVREGVFSQMDTIYAVIAIVLLMIPPVIATMRRGAVGPRGFTERDRWRDSMFTRDGKRVEDDDDE